jgi:hypothetical protein
MGLARDVRGQASDARQAGSRGTAGIAALGSIDGVVRDDAGTPLGGAMVSAVGATTAFAISDKTGRYSFQLLAPGAYVVRAHLGGYGVSRAQTISVQSGAAATAPIALRRATTTIPVLAAGVGAGEPASIEVDTPAEPADTAAADGTDTDDDSANELGWRLRYARRGILRDATLAGDLGSEPRADADRPFAALALVGRTMGSPARLASSFFAETPFSGQVNILTTSSFDTPEQLFSGDTFARGIAYARVGAPVGAQADWTVRGAITQADISAWILAGSYASRSPATHRFQVGMSYSTQRYDGANPLAVQDVADGSRNVGDIYAFDTFTLSTTSPTVTLTYGGHYARYDYLRRRSLLSPRAEVLVVPGDGTRVRASISRRAHAPGAEEFLPPGDSGIWLPPQRTFSSIDPGTPLQAQQATQVAFAVERDIAATTLSLAAFHQRVDDQLVTLFDVDLPEQPTAKLGHYVVSNAGDSVATGYTAEVSTVLARRVHGSIAYTLTKARLLPAADLRNLLLLAPSALRPSTEDLYDVSTAVETSVPETATKVLVLYRVGNGFVRATQDGVASDRPTVDSRFDVQVRQSLPFMNFTSAKWEMLVAIRNFFRETSRDQAVYDERLVVRPPTRIVGGVTMNF